MREAANLRGQKHYGIPTEREIHYEVPIARTPLAVGAEPFKVTQNFRTPLESLLSLWQISTIKLVCCDG